MIDEIADQLKNLKLQITEMAPEPSVNYQFIKLYLDTITAYDGNPYTLNIFLNSCEQFLISFFNTAKTEDPINQFLLKAVLGKLTGRALMLIGNRPEINDWDSIKKALKLNFSDQRDLDSLVQDLILLRPFKNESPYDFGTRCQDARSLILTKIDCSELEDAEKRLQTKNYDDLALKTFIRGLNGHIQNNVRLRNPDTLEKAMTLVIEEENFLYYTQQNNALQVKNPNTSMQNFKSIKPNLQHSGTNNNSQFKSYLQNSNPNFQFRTNFQNYRSNNQNSNTNFQPKSSFQNFNSNNFQFRPNLQYNNPNFQHSNNNFQFRPNLQNNNPNFQYPNNNNHSQFRPNFQSNRSNLNFQPRQNFQGFNQNFTSRFPMKQNSMRSNMKPTPMDVDSDRTKNFHLNFLNENPYEQYEQTFENPEPNFEQISGNPEQEYENQLYQNLEPQESIENFESTEQNNNFTNYLSENFEEVEISPNFQLETEQTDLK